MKKLLAFTLFIALLATSCKKEVVVVPTAAETLQSKVWKLSSVTESGTSVVLAACQADDRFSFSTTGSFEQNYGTTKCGTTQIANSFTGNWSVDEATKTLKIVSALKTYTYTIKSISASTYVLSYENTTLSGGTKVVEETYVPAQ
jgi:Lipocalin-like domain